MARPIQIKTAEPGHRIIEVDPEQAKKWLLLNKKNRKLKRIKIAHYARDMQNGNWQFTGEAIKFNTDGDLEDGQNRLHAIIDAGVTVPLLVITGLNGHAQEVMDSGAPRSAGDALHLRGYKTPNEMAATVRAHYAWSRGLVKHCMSSIYSSDLPTNAEIVAYAEAHPELAAASKAAKPVSSKLRLPHGAVAAAYYEFALLDPEYTATFFGDIIELRTKGKRDPVNVLINRANDMKERRETIKLATGLFLIIKTWNYRREGKSMDKFQFGSERLGWQPIPEPK